jgi:hypothetical protein
MAQVKIKDPDVDGERESGVLLGSRHSPVAVLHAARLLSSSRAQARLAHASCGHLLGAEQKLHMQRAFNRCFRTGPYVLLPCHAKSRPAAVRFTDPIQGGAPDGSIDGSAGEITNALTPTTRNTVVKAVSARCESNSSIVGLNSPEPVVGATVSSSPGPALGARESNQSATTHRIPLPTNLVTASSDRRKLLGERKKY